MPGAVAPGLSIMLRLMLCALIAAVSTAVGAQSGALPQEPLALVNGQVVDVADGTIRRDVAVVLRAGRIDAIDGSVPAGMTTLDVRGRYLVPGLIDAHVHLETLRALRSALESGITTARSAGVAHYADVGLRDLVRQGSVAGPEVLASGYHLRRALAEEAFLDHPDLAVLLPGVTTIDGLRRVARANKARHVDWIKILATERAGTPETDPRRQTYSETELRALVQEAAALGLPVLAHAHGEEGALAAARAGVRSIEHGTYLSEEALRLMAKQGTFFVPTIEVIKDMVEPGGDYDHRDLQLRGRQMLPRLCETVALGAKLGVAIAAGSDSGYRPTSVGRVGAEVANLVECGLSRLAALQAATMVNARLLQRERQIGQIAAGFEADLIAVERNPLQDIRTLQDPQLVISNGRIGVDRLPAVAGSR